MRLTKEQKEQENIISDRSMRDKCVGRYDVLEKVKKLLLLPGTDLMSIDQVADYYEVSSQGIKNLYSQNREEIDGDGTKMLPRDFYNGSNEKSTSVDIKQTSVTYTDDERRGYIRAKGYVEDARELGFKPDMREKIKEYISELNADIERLNKVLEDMITEPEKETVVQKQKDKINFEIIKSRVQTLMDVKCDLQGRLEELL